MLKGGDQSQDFLLRVINPNTEPDACLQSELGMEYLGTVMSGSDGNAAFIEYLSHVMGMNSTKIESHDPCTGFHGSRSVNFNVGLTLQFVQADLSKPRFMPGY